MSARTGIASLLAGIGLYLVASWINLNYYDEGPDYWGPWWLTALTFVAVGFAVFGLASLAFGLASLAWAAVRAFWTFARSR